MGQESRRNPGGSELECGLVLNHRYDSLIPWGRMMAHSRLESEEGTVETAWTSKTVMTWSQDRMRRISDARILRRRRLG